MKTIKRIFHLIKGLIMTRVFSNIETIIKGMEEIARDIPELTIQADKDHQSRKLQDLAETLKAICGTDDDGPGTTTKVHGGGTGDD